MYPYLILFFFALCALFCDKRYKKFLFNTLLWYSILLSGLRYRVGLDTLNYMLFYSDIPTWNTFSVDDFYNFSYQPFYLLLCVLAKSISSDFYVLQLIQAILVNCAFFWFAKKYSNYPFLYIFLYLCTYYTYFNFEIMKEGISVAVFLLIFPYYRERKWGKYYIGAFVSLMFHLSASILFLFPLVRNLKFDKKFILYAAMSVVVFSALFRIYEQGNLVIGMSEVASEKISSYQGLERFNLKWTLFQMFPVAILPLLLLWYTKHMKKKDTEMYEGFLCVRIIMGIGILFFQLIFTRFSNYTTPFLLLLLTECISPVIYKRKVVRLTMSHVWLWVVITYFSILYMLPAARGRTYNQWIPYYSIFNPQRDVVRENMWKNHFVY
nr:EpsG family protein [uncultured Parabacteroides sp.]